MWIFELCLWNCVFVVILINRVKLWSIRYRRLYLYTVLHHRREKVSILVTLTMCRCDVEEIRSSCDFCPLYM